jgi:hypothetical protein
LLASGPLKKNASGHGAYSPQVTMVLFKAFELGISKYLQAKYQMISNSCAEGRLENSSKICGA